jgi:L-2-hydroxyglutarate oxidase
MLFLAFAKEGYNWSKINISEFSKTIFYPGMWKLGRRYLSTGISEMYRSLNKDVFLKEILKYIPDITKKRFNSKNCWSSSTSCRQRWFH